MREWRWTHEKEFHRSNSTLAEGGKDRVFDLNIKLHVPNRSFTFDWLIGIDDLAIISVNQPEKTAHLIDSGKISD